METFDYYVEKGEVIKQIPNLKRAKSLLNDAEARLKDVDNLNIEKFPKIIFENVYDAIRDICDAILISEGWKSYSHEASISYLAKKGFDIIVISELDGYRYKRNGSKYYGEKVEVEEAKEIKLFFVKIKDKLYKLLEKIK
jgi:hypothetical protein